MTNMTQPTGKKFDGDKPRVGLMVSHFPHALMAVARCDTMGAKKYGEDNLFSVENAQKRYMDAAFRHLLEYSGINQRDSESGENHLAHAAWNLLAVLEMDLRKVKPAHARPTFGLSGDLEPRPVSREEKIQHPGFYYGPSQPPSGLISPAANAGWGSLP